MERPFSEPFDLIIVGGGPAGATAALYARRAGLRTLLLDKARFPRDKICGDALGGKAVQILRELDLLEEVRDLPGVEINNIVFGSTRHREAWIDLAQSGRPDFTTGFVIRRQVFDQFLFQKARQAADECLEDFKVHDLVFDEGRVCGVRGRQGESDEEIEIAGRVVLGADGYKSIVACKTGLHDPDLKHWIVAFRRYYENVGGLGDQIELHYVEGVIPGYFWIFPLEDGGANVGIGMLTHAMKRRGVNLKRELDAAIASPHFAPRFQDARPLEKPVGWNLPVGSKHRKNHGDGFLLLGDAAGLIDPFTGEGIGNAMFSARYAVDAAWEACRAGDFSEAFLKRYDRNLWGEIGDELTVSARLQKIGRIKPLLDFTIDRAARSSKVSEVICGMIANEIPRKKLSNPLFYLRLLAA